MCYPGSVVPDDIAEGVSEIIPHNINLIGTHTYTGHFETGDKLSTTIDDKMISEGGFEFV